MSAVADPVQAEAGGVDQQRASAAERPNRIAMAGSGDLRRIIGVRETDR